MRPAPRALGTPSSATTPNSMVSQKTLSISRRRASVAAVAADRRPRRDRRARARRAPRRPDDLVDEVGLGGVEALLRGAGSGSRGRSADRAPRRSVGQGRVPPRARSESRRPRGLRRSGPRAAGPDRQRARASRPLHEAARPVLAMGGSSASQTVRGALSSSVYGSVGTGCPGTYEAEDAAIASRRARYTGSTRPGWSGRDGLDLELSAHGIGRGVPGRRGSPAAPPRDRP